MTKSRKSGELVAFLSGADSEEMAQAHQAYARGSVDELAADAREAAIALHTGTPAEVIALASRDVKAQARAARRLLERHDTPPDAA